MSGPARIVVATGNAHKTAEIAAALAQLGCEVAVVPASAVGGMPDVEETGITFAANARLKAEALRPLAGPGDWVLADDSGLEVDALGGAPGVRSARYAGESATDADNRAKLRDALADVSAEARRARFVCHFTLLGAGVDQDFRGECPGRIAAQEVGEHGFGYDSLFVPDGHHQSFAELGAPTKDMISHRACACQRLAAWLRSRH